MVILALCLSAGALALGWTWYFWQARPHSSAPTLEGLQVFYTLPDFSLVAGDRRPVTRADLLGKVWVANFIYTHCTDTCPLQSARMADLQKEFTDPALRFLSISVDPARDTPAVLTAYAARFGAGERWWFLTGEKAPIYRLVQEGFHLSVEDPSDTAAPSGRPRKPDTHASIVDRLAGWFVSPALAHTPSEFLEPPFLHSSWFVLGDRQTRIRGYYRTEDDASLRQLRKDLGTLLTER
jgi:cytochrome oxidase Cu insertion factor (SCO1/SenC/PrrC family)